VGASANRRAADTRILFKARASSGPLALALGEGSRRGAGVVDLPIVLLLPLGNRASGLGSAAAELSRLGPVAPSTLDERVVEDRLVAVFARDQGDLVPGAWV
jgi:hypothetical protein